MNQMSLITPFYNSHGMIALHIVITIVRYEPNGSGGGGMQEGFGGY